MIHASLRRRTVMAIVATAIVTSLLFGLMTFIFAYAIEDRLFERELANQVNRQVSAWQQGRPPPRSTVPYIRIYRSGTPLPPDLLRGMVAEPERTEFPGDEGRHYHIVRFVLPGPGGTGAIAVAEGSAYLLVRPLRNDLILFLIGLSLAVALVAALIGWWLASRALSPLGRLADNLAGSDRAVPVIDPADYPANEIGVLARSLGTAFDRIRGFVAREQRFTSDASHELRTPLAVIGGAAELLATNADLPLSARPALRRIEAASADMAQSLDLLLALAREREVRRHGPVALLPLVEKAVAAAAIRFPDNGVEVTLDLAPTAKVVVDDTLLQLVLNNLVGNAFQHATGSILTIAGTDRQLTLADTGPGLDDRAFIPFDKGADSQGTGLGLDIVKRLCDSTQVALTTVPGTGTHIRLEFPPHKKLSK